MKSPSRAEARFVPPTRSFWPRIVGALLVALSTLSTVDARASKRVEAPRAVSVRDLDDAVPPSDADKALAEKRDEAAKEPTARARLGIVLNGVTKLDLGAGTYQAEFGAIVTCLGDRPCKPDLDAENGKLTTKELIVDKPELKVYRMRGEFTANVDLSEFPFDRHELPLVLHDRSFKTILERDPAPEASKIDVDMRIPGWSLLGLEWTQDDEVVVPGELVHSAAGVSLRIERPRVASFFKSLVPLAFMIFVAGFSLLLKPKSAAGRLTTATGALMTVVMYHVSATSQLPPLGYMTRFDKFMLATYLVYLVNIGLAIALVRLDDAKNETLSLRVYHVAQGLVPGLALALSTLVFGRLV